MKMFDIAFKDLLRSFRSKFALVMMFAAPLMITGLIYFAFSGLASDEGGFELPVTYVQVVNLDQPDLRSGLEIGQILIESMRSEELADLLQVTQVASEAVARAAVDAQLAAVAVIIPPNFTAAVISAEGSATITLYPDPTLTLGPAVVHTMLSRVVDSFAGTKIAIKVTGDQLNKRGLPLGEEMMAQVALQYTAWLQSQGQQQSGGAYPGLDVQPSPGKAEPVNQRAAIVGPIMAGMLIFFAFFTGASTAQSILREDEGKTLPRLFTTPTRRDVILGGHFTAVFITLVVQTVVLLIASSLIFGVRWGEPLAVALVAVGLPVSGAFHFRGMERTFADVV